MRDLVDSYDTYMALRDLEITIRVNPETDEIVLSPASQVPPALKLAVRQHHSDIVRDWYIHRIFLWVKEELGDKEIPITAEIMHQEIHMAELYVGSLDEFKQAVREYGMAAVKAGAKL